jgi:hypothetical protein
LQICDKEGLQFGIGCDNATIKPRGNAQKEYHNSKIQNSYSNRPTLLEEVGVGQYRLRLYLNQVPHALRFTYKTMLSSGCWPLPKLTEKRNAYWDHLTQRSWNNQTITMDLWRRDRDWLGTCVPATKRSGDLSKSYQTVLKDQGVSITLKPTPEMPNSNYLVTGQKIAVIIDRTQQMSSHADKLKSSVTFLQKKIASNNLVEAYLSSAPIRGVPMEVAPNISTVDAGSIVFYGGQSINAQFQQFMKTKPSTILYDVVILLTAVDNTDLAYGLKGISIPGKVTRY